MKKLMILFLMVIPVFVFGQTRYWNFEYTIDHGVDTVFFPAVDDSLPYVSGDISAYSWTATIQFEGLTDTVTIGIGGGNIPLSYDDAGKVTTTSFSNFVHDSLPYTFIPENCIVTTLGVTDTLKTFYKEDPYGFLRPAVNLITGSAGSDTVFTMKGNFVFSK